MPMLTFCNGREQGLGGGGKPQVFVKVDVTFGRHLGLLKGAKLGVFMAIALHANDEGWAWPSIPAICKESGYNRDAVTKAISELCRLEIDGDRVMLRSQSRIVGGQGRFAGAHYLIFSAKGDIERFEVNKDTAETG